MKKAFAIFLDGIKIFIRAGCLDRAAAISFYAFFSIIPLMLLTIAFLGFVLGTHDGLFEKISVIARQALPYLSERVLTDVKGLATRWKAFSWLGLFSLFLSVELVFNSASKAMADIFNQDKKWGVVRRKVVNLVVFVVALLSALCSVLITAAYRLTGSFELQVLGIDIKYYLVDNLAYKYVAPVALVVLTTALVLRIFSGSRLDLRHAIVGSVFFVVFWEIAKQVFAWYVSNFPSYNRFYGSLGAVMALLLWIFYSTNIFLFSAALAKAAFDRSNGIKRGQKPAGK